MWINQGLSQTGQKKKEEERLSFREDGSDCGALSLSKGQARGGCPHMG
jgi:hypothetical protein